MLPNSIIYSQLYSFTSITRWIAYYGSIDKNLYVVIHEHICLFLSHFKTQYIKAALIQDVHFPNVENYGSKFVGIV